MSKLNDEWVPEVGEKFEASLNESDDILEVTAVFYDEGGTVFRTWKGNYHNTKSCYMHRPIKTEAEKRRDERLLELAEDYYGDKALVDENYENYKRLNWVIDAGWIKPKPLTGKFVFEMITVGLDCKVIAERLNAYIRGEGL